VIVLWTPEAERDRADIWDYIAADNPSAAARMDALFSAAADRLAAHPKMGKTGVILNPAVDRARACRHRVHWQGANRSHGGCHGEDLQRGQRARGRRDRARSALTRWVRLAARKIIRKIKALHTKCSGQLPDLG